MATSGEGSEEAEDDEEGYLCDCGKAFTSNRSYTEHAETCTVLQNQQLLRCQLCEKQLACTEELQKHVIEHFGEMGASCEESGNLVVEHKKNTRQSLVQQEDLEMSSNGEETNEDIQHKCDDCSKVFATHRAKMVHVGMKHAVERFCGICEQYFDKKEPVCSHLQQLLKKKPRKRKGEIRIQKTMCDVCRLTVPEEALQNHKGMIDGTQLACADCPSVFLSECERVQHVRTLDHKAKEKSVCLYCRKYFISTYKLYEHKLTFHADKPGVSAFVCQFCGKKYGRLKALKEHEIIHSGEKSFICHSCGAGFISKDYLKKHMFAHTDAKPYKCNECGKGLRTGWALTLHKRLHTGEKAFSCKVCNVRFRQLGDCKKHEKMHDRYPQRELPNLDNVLPPNFEHGEMTYECSTCQEQFIDEMDCSEHEKLHAGIS